MCGWTKKNGVVTKKTAVIATPAITRFQSAERRSHGVERSSQNRRAASMTSGIKTSPAVYLKPIASPVAAPASTYQRRVAGSDTTRAPQKATAVRRGEPPRGGAQRRELGGAQTQR